MVLSKAGAKTLAHRDTPGDSGNDGLYAAPDGPTPVLDTWNQTVGDWTDSADWSDQVPTANNAVQIEGGAVTISVSDGSVEANSVDIFTIPQVSLSTPVLTTDGTLTTGALLLTEGTIDGAGTIDASLFMQGGDSAAEDQPTYSSTVAGSLAVVTGSLTVGGGKDGGFDIGGGTTLTATGSSSVHQGFIDGAGTLQNGVYGDTGAMMAFFNSGTADTVTNGFSPFNNVTTLGSFINWGTANFDGTPSQFLNDGLVAASIANNGFIQLGAYGGAVATLDGDISGASFANNGQIEVLSGTASIGVESSTTLGGSGGALIASDARLIVQLAGGGVGSGQVFNFAYSSDAVLQLDGSVSMIGAAFAGQISNFVPGDTIDLAGVPLSSITGIGPSADNTAYVVTTTAGTIDLAVAGGITTTDILLAQGDGAGTDLVFATGGVDTFTNGEGDGQWTTPGNWSISYGGGVPSLTDTAIVQALTVTIGTGDFAQASTLLLEQAAGLILQGTLFLENTLEITAGNQIETDRGDSFEFASSNLGITVDAGARFVGDGSVSVPIVDNGLIEVIAGGSLQLSNGLGNFITGTGTLLIDAGSTLQAAAGSGLTVMFNQNVGLGGQLQYAYEAAGFNGPTLEGLQLNDSILIGGFAQGTPTATDNGATLAIASGSQTATFALLNPNPGLEFVATETANGGVLVTAVDNIPPVITAPLVQIVGTAATTPIAGVSISDADPSYTQITATVALSGAGALTMDETATGGGSTSGATLTITGTAAQIDADLATLAYADSATAAQVASVTLTAHNNGPDNSDGTNQATPQTIVLASVPADGSGFTTIASGDWNTGATWSGGVPPGITNDAIDDGAFYVAVSDAQSAQSLTIASAASEVDVYGTLTLAGSQSAIDLAAGGLGLFGGTIDFQGGTLDFAGGTLVPQSDGSLNDLTVTGALDVTGNITIGGSFAIVASAASQPQINVSVTNLGEPVSLYFSQFSGLDVPITLTGLSNYQASLGGANLELTDTTVAMNNGAIDGTAVGAMFGTTITSTGTSSEQAASFSSDGTIVVAGGIFSVTAGAFYDGGGTVQVDSGGTLFIAATATAALGLVVGNDGSTTEIAASISNAGTFLYNDPSTLILDDPTAFGAAIGGFGAGDVLDLTGEDATGGSISGTVLTVTLAGGGTQTLNVVAGQDGVSFSATADGGLEVNCFLSGTRIATPGGEVAVEALRIGDCVQTPDGAVPIRWIGHRRIDARRHPRPDAVRPIRIRADAFGPGQPRRGLFLSPDHATLFEDALIPVKYLCNGTTIDQATNNLINYHHIELDRHAVVLAEGLWVETYLETGSRAAFSNNDSVVDLHAAFEPRRDHHYMMWETFGYARLAITGPVVERARALLARRADRLSSRANPRPRARAR